MLEPAEIKREKPREIKIGDKIGMLTVEEGPLIEQRGGSKRKFWICRCDCGELTKTDQYKLTSGRSRSCGCMFRKSKARYKALQT